MSIVMTIQAGGLAVTGADPMPWWLWAIAGALVVLGIAFLLLRRRGGDEADDVMAAPLIATVDPAAGQGFAATTPVPAGVSDDEAAEQIFKPAETPADPDDGVAEPSAEEPPTSDGDAAPGGVADPDTKP